MLATGESTIASGQLPDSRRWRMGIHIVAVVQDDIGATVFKLGAGDDLKKTRAVNVLGPIKRIYF